MRETHLIFVEGIMGAGKTTTAQFIAGQLEQHRMVARFVLEGPTRDEPEHPLRVATSLPHPLAVWLDVTVEQYIELSLQKWQAFAREAQESSTVAVCDGLLFHGNMADLLLMDAEPQVLHGYVE